MYNVVGDDMKRLILIFVLSIMLCGCSQNEIYPPAIFESAPVEDVYVVFLSLDYGFCALADIGDQNILIGCGESGDFPRIYEFLNEREVKALDVVIFPSDFGVFTGGFQKLCANFEIGRLYIGNDTKNSDKYRGLMEVNSPSDGSIHIMNKGTRIYDKSGLTIDVLSSQLCVQDGKAQSASTLLITYGKNTILIEGNGDLKAEEQMEKEYPDMLKADVLSVPFGGTKAIPGRSFVDCVRPVYAVISAAGEDYPDISLTRMLEDAGCEVIRPDADGDVVFTLTDEGTEYHIIKKGQ